MSRLARRLGTAVVVIAALAVASIGEAQEAPKSGGTLRAVFSADPPTLDPAQATDLTSAAVVRQIFDALLELDERLRPLPALAAGWTVSADQRVYTFRLRPGVRFHSGRELRAADVKFSFERAARGKRPWVFDKIAGGRDFIERRAEEIAGIRVVDDLTVEIRLDRPFAPFLHLMAYDAASVVPREHADTPGFASHPVGTGAFRFVSWRRDEQLVLGRFPGHFRGPAYLDGIVFRILPEDLTRLNEYRAGQLDVTGVPASYCRIVERDQQLRGDLATWPTLGTQGVRFNVERAPYGDTRVRRAIAHAIDATQVVKTVQYGCAVPARGILPPGMPRAPAEPARLAHDPALARRLLEAAGLAGPGAPSLTYHYNTGTANQRTAEVLQAQLREIGVRLELRRLDWAAYLSLVDDGEAGFYRAAWIADYPDPENFLAVLFHSRNAGAAGNTSRYSDATVDRALDEADAMPVGAARDARYEMVERRVVDAAVWVPLYHLTSRALVRPYVKGLERSPLSSAPEFLSPLRKVWLAR